MSANKPSSLGISGHFSREAKFMLLVALLPIIIGLEAAVILPRLLDQGESQACAPAQEQNAACKPQPQEQEQH